MANDIMTKTVSLVILAPSPLSFTLNFSAASSVAALFLVCINKQKGQYLVAFVTYKFILFMYLWNMHVITEKAASKQHFINN